MRGGKSFVCRGMGTIYTLCALSDSFICLTWCVCESPERHWCGGGGGVHADDGAGDCGNPAA